MRNFRIFAIHPVYRWVDGGPFKGTLPKVKAAARQVLDLLEEPGWVIRVQTDDQIIYCERKL